MKKHKGNEMKKRRFNLPYLSIFFDVGFLVLRTDLMAHSAKTRTFNYIVLEWKFFKWSGQLRLYSPDYRL